ncbi:MAG: Rod shape-determining protein RodA [Microgenomates bacterium OLB22]|nr:MAG: Rod shape-determining protein RodA [Microgenomates bacterium OLB22]
MLGGIPFFLVLRQPDLGTSLNYLIMIGSMLFLAGTSVRFFVGCIAFLVLSSPLIWAFLHDYQRNRILGFLDPTYDPQGITYNVQQAIIAIGSGGFLGKGLGLGTQSRFRFLPEYYTDFAFASLVEQFGFLGGVVVITLLLSLIITVLSIAYRSRSDMEAFFILCWCRACAIPRYVYQCGDEYRYFARNWYPTALYHVWRIITDSYYDDGRNSLSIWQVNSLIAKCIAACNTL